MSSGGMSSSAAAPATAKKRTYDVMDPNRQSNLRGGNPNPNRGREWEYLQENVQWTREQLELWNAEMTAIANVARWEADERDRQRARLGRPEPAAIRDIERGDLRRLNDVQWNNVHYA